MTPRLRSVFAPVVALAFNAQQENDCRNFLLQKTADTELLPIVDESQLIMSPDARIASTGYRFNAVGFAALANTLVVGLNGLFNELSGEARNAATSAAESGELLAAVSIYNTAVRTRFEAVRERALLVNHKEKTIDGFLGMEHRFMDNSVFLDMVSEEMRNNQDAASFYRAELVGRELTLYYSDAATKRTFHYAAAQYPVCGGWCFSNREDSGVAIRASVCIMTSFGAAVEPRTRSTSLPHVGADFAGRAAILLSKCAARKIDVDNVLVALRRLGNTSLNFTDNKKSIDAATTKLVRYLQRFKVPKEPAKNVCSNAASVGADLVRKTVIESYVKESLESRTFFDLFCSMLRYSRGQYRTTRDALQGAAMQLLTLPKGAE